MKKIENKTFGGERPLFGAHDVRLEDITITDGESGIKCCFSKPHLVNSEPANSSSVIHIGSLEKCSYLILGRLFSIFSIKSTPLLIYQCVIH